jgi:outer membrane lipoprotein SlyB
MLQWKSGQGKLVSLSRYHPAASGATLCSMRAIQLSALRQYLALGGTLALLSGLTGCAVPAPVTPAPRQAATGSFYTGTVVSVRHVGTTANSTSAVNQVMSALGQPPAATQASAMEIVIRLADGSVRTFAQPTQPALARLSPGKRVTVTEAAETTIHQE